MKNAQFCGSAALLSSLFFLASGCANVQEVQEIIPGDSLAKANRSLAMQTMETSAALALATIPSCRNYRLVNTEIIRVSEPLQIVGVSAKQGNWVERWTYEVCGASVPINVEFAVDEFGTVYNAPVAGVVSS